MNDLCQRLTEGHQFLPFGCGDNDLNEFHNHSSVEPTNNAWRKIKGSLPHEKHRKDYPAYPQPKPQTYTKTRQTISINKLKTKQS